MISQDQSLVADDLFYAARMSKTIGSMKQNRGVCIDTL